MTRDGQVRLDITAHPDAAIPYDGIDSQRSGCESQAPRTTGSIGCEREEAKNPKVMYVRTYQYERWRCAMAWWEVFDRMLHDVAAQPDAATPYDGIYLKDPALRYEPRA
ncbi:hypothetical protein DFH28DRAFT_922332 [Melampsora americana]|nr:hypothetical protein DFH28DRAFT_922332 [Melampsora americana]